MKCKITLKDEVNCKVEGLDIDTRRKCEKELKFFLPYAYHVPAFKLGRWDGCQSYLEKNMIRLFTPNEEDIMRKGFVDVNEEKSNEKQIN